MHPPADLFMPIISHKSTVSFLLKPQASITPTIDGKNNSFFEWLGSGSIDESKLYSTMDRVRGPIEKIHYGQNDESVFVAFEGEITSLKMSNLQLEVIIEETGEHLNFSLDMDKPYNAKKIELAMEERLELSISKSYFKDHRTVHLRFEIVQGNEIIQTMHGYGALSIDVNETYTENWFV